MIRIYTDGACEPNPGAGGWAFVVYRDGAEAFSQTGGSVDTTNNIMEMTAVLAALEHAARSGFNPDATVIHSDSQYCVKGCTEWRHKWKRCGWRRGKSELANSGLWQALATAHDAFPCKIEWVRGHVGIAGNERADELAEAGRVFAIEAVEYAA